jgi:bacteriorhodopsin
VKLLPIAERELRVASRRRGTYWIRFGAVALALGTASVIFLAMMRERPADQAQVLFLSLSVWRSFIAC